MLHQVLISLNTRCVHFTHEAFRWRFLFFSWWYLLAKLGLASPNLVEMCVLLRQLFMIHRAFHFYLSRVVYFSRTEMRDWAGLSFLCVEKRTKAKISSCFRQFTSLFVDRQTIQALHRVDNLRTSRDESEKSTLDFLHVFHFIPISCPRSEEEKIEFKQRKCRTIAPQPVLDLEQACAEET